MSGTMVNDCIVVHMLTLVGYDTPAKVTFRPFTVENKIGTIACDTVVQRYDVVIDAAVGLLVDIHIAHSDILCMSFLKALELQMRTLSHTCLHHLCGKEIAIIGSMVTEEQFNLGVFLHNYKHTAVYHEVH